MLCPDVTVIIRTFNEEKHIQKLLEACFSQKTQFTFEIIIVDSGSTDQTLEIIKKYPVKILNINSKDFTYGGALNLGAENSSAAFAICVSAHCYPATETWLEELLTKFNDPKVAMVYGRQIGDKRTKFSEAQIFHQYFPEKISTDQNVIFSNNANSAFRRSVWDEVKFDETLPGLEDIDWAKKIISKGLDVIYAPKACVYHIHEETYAQVYKRYYREAVGFKTIYPSAQFKIHSFISAFLKYTGSDFYFAFKKKSLFENSISILFFRFNQFAATFSAYKEEERVR